MQWLDDIQMRIFHTAMELILLIQVTIQLKMGLIIEPDLVFSDGTTFKFLKDVVCEISPPHSAPRPSFSDWQYWIFNGRNFTTFVSLCNDVLGMLNCWEACRMKVVG